MKLRFLAWSVVLLLAFSLSAASALAQNSAPGSSDDKSSKTADQSGASGNTAAPQTSDQSADPLKRPLTEKQKKTSSKALKLQEVA